jgi:hypothetical protein
MPPAEIIDDIGDNDKPFQRFILEFNRKGFLEVDGQLQSAEPTESQII